LYQFLLNSEDSMVIEYLKRLTFLSREEIEAIEAEHNAAPEKRLAQKKLAEEILRDLHGEGAYESAVRISELLFAGKIKEIPVNDLLAGLKDVPHFETKGGNVMDVLVGAGVCSSKREAREFISGGSLTLNGDPLKDMSQEINADTCLAGRYLVVRRGKKKYYLGELV
jgi:tyrosyl-tRNA synthetase